MAAPALLSEPPTNPVSQPWMEDVSQPAATRALHGATYQYTAPAPPDTRYAAAQRTADEAGQPRAGPFLPLPFEIFTVYAEGLVENTASWVIVRFLAAVYGDLEGACGLPVDDPELTALLLRCEAALHDVGRWQSPPADCHGHIDGAVQEEYLDLAPGLRDDLAVWAAGQRWHRDARWEIAALQLMVQRLADEAMSEASIAGGSEAEARMASHRAPQQAFWAATAAQQTVCQSSCRWPVAGVELPMCLPVATSARLVETRSQCGELRHTMPSDAASPGTAAALPPKQGGQLGSHPSLEPSNALAASSSACEDGCATEGNYMDPLRRAASHQACVHLLDLLDRVPLEIQASLLSFVTVPTRITCKALQDAYNSRCSVLSLHWPAACAPMDERLPFMEQSVAPERLTDLRRLLAEMPLLQHVRSSMPVLAPLSACTALRSLDLQCCHGLCQIDVLAGLPSLVKLDLGCCQELTSIAGLSGCTSLAWLNLTHCVSVADLRPLADITALKFLDLCGCTSVTCIDALETCTTLTCLDLEETRVSDLQPLAACASLSFLGLYGCTHLSDIAPLGDCTALDALNMFGCTGVTSISELSSCSRLQRLELHNCDEVTDVSALESCTALQALGMSCWGIRDLSPLHARQALRRLDLLGCAHLEDLAPLSRCTELRRLQLSHCDNLTDLTPLSACIELLWLSLKGCPGITDIAPLSACTALVNLNLEA